MLAMNQHAATMLVLGTIGLVALVALALGLAGGSTTSEGSLFQPTDPEAGAAVSGCSPRRGGRYWESPCAPPTTACRCNSQPHRNVWTVS